MAASLTTLSSGAGAAGFRRPPLHGDWQLVEPPQAHLLGELRRAFAREGRDAREPLLIGDARLEAGERLADALVIAAAHAEDARNGAANVEDLRILEDRFVMIGRTDKLGDHAARRDLHPCDLHVPKRLALQEDDRAIEPQGLLERIRGERQVVGDEAHLLRVFQQAIQGQRDRLRRQIIARDHGELHEGQRFTFGQLVAALGGLDEIGNQILSGRLATLLNLLLEKRLHILRVARDLFVALLPRRIILNGVGRVAAHHRIGPARERLHHRGVDAQKARHHRRGKRKSEPMEEVALVALRQDVVDELAGDFPRVRLHRSHALGREGLLHERPDPRVLRRVFPQKGVDLGLFLGARHRLRALEGRGECPEVSENRVAIGPLQETDDADRLDAADRPLGAQVGQQPVALPSEIGVADVENRQRVEPGRDRVARASRYTLLSF